MINAASVLDASALMALLHDEDGAENVAEALAASAAISVVNIAEVLSKLADAGKTPNGRGASCARQRVRLALSPCEPLTEADCVEAARLCPRTPQLGLSLADRACLALSKRLALPVLTADRRWAETDINLEVRLIR